ncbi:MAG: YceI family protein [Pseudomonadota bacterium]
MKSKKMVLAAAFVAALMASGAAFAQAPTPPKADAAAAVAGTYALDPNHTSIVARVLHQGFSYSTFRFGKSEGELIWDPKSPAADKVTVNVETASIMSPANGGAFPAELSGDRFLKSAQFPKATFVSTKFTQSSPAKGKVDGTLTLLGVTKPISFDVTLVGAGSGRAGPVMGVSGVAKLNAADFGLPAMLAAAPIELQVDAEFKKP